MFHYFRVERGERKCRVIIVPAADQVLVVLRHYVYVVSLRTIHIDRISKICVALWQTMYSHEQKVILTACRPL